jgi:hypothetical protein
MNTKKSIIIGTCVLFAIIAIRIVLGWNELRADDAKIRQWLLQRTPLGTEKQVVSTFIDAQGWKDNSGKKDSGFFDVYLRDSPHQNAESALEVVLGGYPGFPWHVTVIAVWVFDIEGHLIDLKVFKISDSL